MSDTGSPLIHLDVADGIATIRLDRPGVNAINVEMQAALKIAADACAADPAVAAVVLTGSARAFAAGVDIAEMRAMTEDEMAVHVQVMNAPYDAIAAIPKPVVAAVSGYALGGGCELALCADFRICATNAVFSQPEILLGLIPGAGGTQRLARLVGPARAKDLIFTGRQVMADEALALGLVDEVVEPADLLTRAEEWARRFVGGPAVALAAAKRAVDAGETAGFALERRLFASLFGTEDRALGMASFLESGPGKARFVGR